MLVAEKVLLLLVISLTDESTIVHVVDNINYT